MSEVRVCNRCGTERPIAEYGKDARWPDAKHRTCKPCVRACTSRWRKANPEAAEAVKNRALAKRREASALRIAARAAERERTRQQRQEAARERARERYRQAYAANPEKHLAKARALRQRIPERVSEWRRQSRERTKARDPVGYLLNTRMSSRMHKALNRGKAGTSWRQLVDYTVEELRAHIEAQFSRGMSWDNIGEWHIDHIVPLSSFRIQSPEDDEFRRAWGLPNLRPMWASDNIRKGARPVTLL